MAKLINLIGQKFDMLTVIEKAESRKRHVYWKCRCDCGNECEISGESLRKNIPHNCGCIKQQKIEQDKKIKELKENYLVGQKFGKLTVIKKTDKRINNSIVWLCQCECSNTKEVPTHLLTSNHTQSCGCLIRETHGIDITNQRFGKLIALYPLPRTTKGALFWHCKCDCGNECDINGNNLRAGKTHSCGCITTSIGEENIEKILKENQIPYKKEFSFNDLINIKTNKKFRFDFAIFKNEQIIRLIEFDGEQHINSTRGTWENHESLEEIQQRDQEKNLYAKMHNIPLIRIPYWERDNITLDMIMGDQYLIS